MRSMITAAMFRGSADEYVAWLPGVMANFEATVHSLTNTLFVVRGEEAQGELYTHAYHRTPAPGCPRDPHRRALS